jgi:hypothetical protein
LAELGYLLPPTVLYPPKVFVTANNHNVDGQNPAVTGIARNVTTDGFTLAAHNTAKCMEGHAGFYWVAIGCAPGCGSGTPEG